MKRFTTCLSKQHSVLSVFCPHSGSLLTGRSFWFTSCEEGNSAENEARNSKSLDKRLGISKLCSLP